MHGHEGADIHCKLHAYGRPQAWSLPPLVCERGNDCRRGLNFEADIRDVAFQRVTTVVLLTLVAQLVAPAKDNRNGDRKPVAAKCPGAVMSNKKERGKRSKTDAADAVQNASLVDKAWYLSDRNLMEPSTKT